MKSRMTPHEEERYVSEILTMQEDILNEPCMLEERLSELGSLMVMTGQMSPILLNCLTFTLNAMTLRRIKSNA